jgi:dinuclear metal center YbgI/SA1388 family protein
MKVHVTDILEGLNHIAPFTLAESWDNVGLLIGDPGREVGSLLIGLDPSLSLLDEAIKRGIDTIVTHHPCIFRPLPSVNIATPGGAFLERALNHKINVIACHTNFDSAVDGVSDALARLLKIENVRPLRAIVGSENEKTGLGRIGAFASPLLFSDFMQRFFQAVASSDVQLAGPKPTEIKCVALCGGSGSDLAEEAHRQNADVYISSEIKHSTAVWAQDAGFCVIDATHYGTEKPAMLILEQHLESFGEKHGWSVEIFQSETEKAPFSHISKENYIISKSKQPDTGE